MWWLVISTFCWVYFDNVEYIVILPTESDCIAITEIVKKDFLAIDGIRLCTHCIHINIDEAH